MSRLHNISWADWAVYKRFNQMFTESSMESAAKLLAILVVTALGVPAAAQRVEFEVASVKLHTSDDQRVMMVAQPGGRAAAPQER